MTLLFKFGQGVGNLEKMNSMFCFDSKNIFLLKSSHLYGFESMVKYFK